MPTRVLLVEDDARVAAFVRRGLESEGYAVDTAADGPAGLAMARAAAYPLILLDRRLPTLDGLEVCRALREEGCGAMVLMLTARGGLQDRVEGLRGGADDYLAIDTALIVLTMRRSGTADAERWSRSAVASWRGCACG